MLPCGRAWAAGTPAKEYAPCTTKADEGNVQAARGAFEAGKAAFVETDYPRAILYWEDAFRRDCSAVLLLKNLARAYEANGQYTEALVALRTYLEREPAAPDRDELDAQLQDIEAKLHKPAAQTSPAVPRPVTPPRSRTKTPPPPNQEPKDDWAAAETDSASEASGGRGSGQRVGAAVLTGVGTAAALAGGVLWLNARADEAEANDECPTRVDCPPGVTDRGNDAIDRKQRWAIVGLGGVALAAGGVVWYLLTPSDEEQAFTPLLSPHFAGASWTARF